ncbi:F-box protein At1g20360-like [Lycium barbarum]|uniref:F-box protein At1g20360-like n=1 Tax=Lycium barbarum TaxID=112863 RepID=UPI00293F5438|nr:F-box protein At1g20360-like [Lycium barbarum]
MTMKLNDDLVVEIISHLPLKLAIQCKLISKNFNRWISNPKFSQTLFQHDQKVWTLAFASTSHGVSRDFQKIFRNLIIPNIHHQTSLFRFSVVAACKGLLLLVFHEVGTFCVFNPITRAHQLIPYPKHYEHKRIGDAGLFVDYPTSDQYILVTVDWLDEGKGYNFQVLSSKERSGLWREVQFRMTPGSNIKPTYVHYSLHWLTSGNRVLAFDAKREEATILDPPEFLNIHNNIHNNPKGRRIRKKLYCSYEKLVMVQGQLTLVRTYKKSTMIAAYDCESSNWRVSPTLEKTIWFVLPICIDGKQVLFLVGGGYMYEYDSEINTLKKPAVCNEEYGIPGVTYSFKPSLAPVHETLSRTVDAKHLPGITATLDELRRCITKGIN